ncbi:hypothetical protein V1283_005820 [Bradyrhizobium sp. AZCC 2262]|uniref:hypothetical protein n=1 Tax=Bradyrhizobium sp. AZCC 2262 TaxID=3117022 RepID=UPI002FF1FF47
MTDVISGIESSDSAIAREAAKLVRQHETEMLFNHSLRIAEPPLPRIAVMAISLEALWVFSSQTSRGLRIPAFFWLDGRTDSPQLSRIDCCLQGAEVRRLARPPVSLAND